jgi:hypothetical protein
MARAVKGLGTTISIGGTLIGNLTDISPLNDSVETMEVTTLDSTVKDYITGIRDGGEVSISGFFEPGNAGQVALNAALVAGTESQFIVTFPSAMGATVTFNALVTSRSAGATISDPVSFEATLLLTSAPNLGTTASTGASALVILADDGSSALTAFDITPAFAIGTFYYAATYSTDTDFTVKVTAASHTIKLYIDGTYIEDLTSGTASSVQLQSADTSKKIEVIAYESGKNPVTYTIMLGRTA